MANLFEETAKDNVQDIAFKFLKNKAFLISNGFSERQIDVLQIGITDTIKTRDFIEKYNISNEMMILIYNHSKRKLLKVIDAIIDKSVEKVYEGQFLQLQKKLKYYENLFLDLKSKLAFEIGDSWQDKMKNIKVEELNISIKLLNILKGFGFISAQDIIDKQEEVLLNPNVSSRSKYEFESFLDELTFKFF